MNRKTNLGVALLVAAVLVAVGIGTAVAANMDDSPPATLAVEKPVEIVNELTDLAVFRDSSTETMSARDRQALLRIGRDAGEESIVSRIDLATAKSSPVAGGEGQVWIASTPDGFLCLFTPANGGYGSACGTTDDVSRTGMTGVSMGIEPESLIAVSVVPDGGRPLKVHESDGSTREIRPTNNVSATVVKPSDVVSSDVATVDVAKLIGPEAPR